MKRINFVCSRSKNYVEVQNQLISLISPALPTGSWSRTYRKKRSGAVNITFFNKQPGDILMSHGVADKNYFFRQRKDGRYLLNGFDHGFVPGNWLRNRLIHHPDIEMPPENIHIVGWPRLDMLINMAKLKKPTERLRILWAPTHNHKNSDQRTVSSYPEFERYLPRLRERFDVDVSLHPRNRTDKTPTGEKMAQCDVVISDFGTTVYEAVALGIPVLFPDWIVRQGIVDEYGDASPGQLYQRNIGLHPQSFDEMMDMLIEGPTLDELTKTYVGDIIEPTTIGQSGQITADTLLKLSTGYASESDGVMGWVNRLKIR